MIVGGSKTCEWPELPGSFFFPSNARCFHIIKFIYSLSICIKILQRSEFQSDIPTSNTIVFSLSAYMELLRFACLLVPTNQNY